MKPINYWIQQLQLIKHVEGGYFKEIYRSNEKIPVQALATRFTKEHCYSTSIYYLLPGNDFSAFHRLKADEIWHFYAGCSLTIFLLHHNGKLQKLHLGADLEKGQQLQIVVPHGHWFAAKVDDPESYTLLGCTVAPGFEYDDFELAKREPLLKQFPQHKDVIIALTRS